MISAVPATVRDRVSSARRASSRRGRSHCSKTPASRRHRRLPRPRSRRLVPLRWMYRADIPVVQLAVQPARGTAHHVALGRALAPLRAGNVPIIGSGHATHNLRDWMSNRNPSEPMRYAADFARWLESALAAHDERALVDGNARPAHRARIPPRSIVPLFVAYGAAGDAAPVERVVDGFENGALRDSFRSAADTPVSLTSGSARAMRIFALRKERGTPIVHESLQKNRCTRIKRLSAVVRHSNRVRADPFGTSVPYSDLEFPAKRSRRWK